MAEMRMKVVECNGFGKPEVLQIGERERAQAGAGEVLIQVSASGVNRPDVLQRKGLYPPPPGAPDTLGLEVAGTIVAGDEVAMRAAGLRLGERVCALISGGGYAEFCSAPAAQCLPVPEGWTDVEAASLPETLFTVWSNLVDRGRMQAGETLLIQGGSSGIGVTAIQLAKALGVRVIVTAGSDDKCQACLDLGADLAINYKIHDFQKEVMRLTDDQGVDLILDMVAGDYVAKEVACLREDGRLVIIAVQGGLQSSFNAGLVLRKRLTITGSTLRVRPIAFKAAIAQACRRTVWPLLERRQVKPVIHRTFEAKDASQAHALMESNAHIGKIILTWGAHAS